MSAGWFAETACLVVYELGASGTHQADFEVETLVGAQELEVTFHADGVLFACEFGPVEMVGLVPWARIAVEIVEECGRVLVGIFLLSAV